MKPVFCEACKDTGWCGPEVDWAGWLLGRGYDPAVTPIIVCGEEPLPCPHCDTGATKEQK